MSHSDNIKKNQSLTSVEPITPEHEALVRVKLDRSAEYITSFLVGELKLYPYKHPFKGINFALQEDTEVAEGSGIGHPAVFLHISKYFGVLNRGKYGQKLNSNVDLTIKGRLSKEERESFGLETRITSPHFSYDYNVATGHLELKIADEEGLDILLMGKYDNTLWAIIRLLFDRYKETRKG